MPLESRVDFLTLQSGQKFELPFMVLVIFATNIKPSELVDEAFLRRIHYKVFAESPTVGEFMQIFENCCRDRGADVRPRAGRRTAAELLRAAQDSAPRLPAARSASIRCCRSPTTGASRRELTPDLLEAACAGYFVDEREATVLYA